MLRKSLLGQQLRQSDNSQSEKVLPLQSAKEELGSYVQNKVKILGLNVVDGLLSIDFRSGQRLSDNYNTFSLRNIYLKIGNEEIWSDEFGKDEYFNESLNFGENNQNPDYRFNYRLSRVLTFTVRPDLLDCSGTLWTETVSKISP